MADMILPGRTRQQLAQDLRQRSPKVVVLITSGYFNPEFETEDPESRTYFLAKPYSRRTLLDKIEEILATTEAAGTTEAKPRPRPASQAG
jgi:FixJ family two-component response regulator